MGSALNCLSYRIAHNEKWTGGRSACPECGHTLGVLDLIPLFSWIFLKGKCRYCKKKISIRYPATELILAAAYVALLFKFDITLQFAVSIILISCLFCLSLVDLDVQLIPDRFLIIPAVARLIELFIEGGFKGLWNGIWPALIFGGAILLVTLVLDKVLKKESMGGGDIKLIFLLGLFFSLPECLLLMLLACMIGLIIAVILMKVKEGTPFPFGPALSIAGFFTLLFGESITTAYMSLF